MATAYEIARALKYDLGINAGIRYAERIATYTADTQFRAEYLEAAEILRSYAVIERTDI